MPQAPQAVGASQSGPLSCLRPALALRVKLAPTSLDFFGQQAFLWQRHSVLCGEYFVGESFERVFCNRMIPLGAQDQPNRWVLAGKRPVFAGVIQVQMHLSCIPMRESSQLEINDDETSEPSVKKQ